MYSIKSVLNPLSSFKSEPLDSTSIQPILTLLGWQDIQSAVELAENQDRVLAQSLQNAYAVYQAAPNAISKSHLNAVLDSVIKKLDADALQAEKLAQAAALRLKQKEISRESTRNGWMASIRKGLQGLFSPDSIKESLQSLFSSDDTVLVERYTALTERYQSKRAALETYRDALTDLQTTDEGPKIETHQRKLLSETTVPNTIPDQVAYVGEMYDFTIDVSKVFGTRMQALAITGNFPDWIQPDYYPLMANCPLTGTVNAITVVGTKAYVAAGVGGLYILDVANPSAPVILGNYDTPGTAYKVAVSNNTAYVADGGSLQILNVTNPAQPTYLANYSYLGAVQDVTLHDDFAYVIDGSLLQQLNISNPYNLAIVGGGVLPGIGNQVLGNKDTIYVAATTGIYTYNCSLFPLPPPTLLGQYTTAGGGYSVTVVGTIAYVAEGTDGGWNGVQIIDVANLAAPSILGEYITLGRPWKVFLIERIAYLPEGNGWSGLQIINVTIATTPTLLGQYATRGEAYDVTVVGEIAYIAEHNNWSGIQILNVSNPCFPTLLSQYATPGMVRSIIVIENIIYAAEYDGSFNGLQILNVSNPNAPILVGQYATLGGVRGISIVGTTIYLAERHIWSGLQILNISNPAIPTLIGQYATPGAARSVVVQDMFVYLVEFGTWNGLQIFDVSNLAAPILVGEYATPGEAQDVSVVGDTAYIAERFSLNGLQIINVTNYSKNLPLGSYSTLSPILELGISNNSITVLLNSEIQQLSLFDPINPALSGNAKTLNIANGIIQAGVAAYVSEGSSGFQIFNMANVGKPILIGAYDTLSTASITVINNTAYIADNVTGMQILNFGKIRLRGVPSSSNLGERYNFTVTATDGLGNWLTCSFRVTVELILPTIIRNQLLLQNGESIILTENNLEALDSKGHATPDLIFTIGDLLNGHFESIQTPNRSITTFIQQYVRDGIIKFVHSGNQQAPSYTIIVTDGVRNSFPNPSVVHFADAPILQISEFTVGQNQTIILNQSNFNAAMPSSAITELSLSTATSSDDNASQIQFEFSNVENGYFAVNGTPTNKFTQQQVNQGQTSFSQNGSPNTPSYDVAVQNIASGTSTTVQTGNVTFHDSIGNIAPQIILNQLFIRQGQARVLTLDNLRAVDAKQGPDSEIIWVPSNVQHGNFYWSNDPSISPPSFTQADIIQGRIQFIQHGSREKPDYRLKARNMNGLSSSTSKPSITFQTVNYPPVLFQSIPDQLVTLGIAFDFGIPETTFKDPEGNPIILFAQGFNQSILPNWLSFNLKSARFTGITHQTGVTLIQIKGADPEGAFATTQFAIVAQAAGGTTPNDGLNTVIRNAVVASLVSGIIGFGFLGARYCLSKRMEKQLGVVLKRMYATKVEQENEDWKQNTLLPLAHAFFDHFKTTGLCGYRKEKETDAYLNAITKLLFALRQQDVEIDFSQLEEVDRVHSINVIVTEIHKAMIANKKCCSKIGFFSTCRPAFTAEQLSAKVDTIARAIGSELRKGKPDELGAIEMKGKKKWPQNKKELEPLSEPLLPRI